jgi:hypothetical protein
MTQTSVLPEVIEDIKARREALEVIKAQLKTEFFGLDAIIDRIVESVQTWFLLPEAINYPVIINLWGLTGVGKTALVRSLVKKLQFQNKFVEIQMDGFSLGSGFYQDSVCSILEASSIEEGEPGILLLDEFQRFRTIELDKDGDPKELDVKRYQDIWMLLSDGKFSTDYSLYARIEKELLEGFYNDDFKQARADAEEEDEAITAQEAIDALEGIPIEKTIRNVKRAAKKKKKVITRKYKLSPWEAVDYKKLLKLKDSVADIMTWDIQKINMLCREALDKRVSSEIDYSKLLVFICGNLDEAYRMAGTLEDCDTDADIFHEETKRISVVDIKSALRERFRAEQIARLGNTHIIYPSLSRKSYESIIASTAGKYVKNMQESIGVTFHLENSVYKEIYDNAVFPTQGTRPVFSSIHQILSSTLVDFSIWSVENNLNDTISVSIDDARSVMIATHGTETKEAKIHLDIREQRSLNTVDFNTMVSVHEAGHSLIYAVLYKCAPKEIKINLTLWSGGYNRFDEDDIMTKTMVANYVAVCLGGRAAEELIFGKTNVSTGAAKDLIAASDFTAKYFKWWGFDDTLAQVRPAGAAEWVSTDYKRYNPKIERMIEEQYDLAKEIIVKYSELFKIIVDALLENKTIQAAEFIKIAKPYIPEIQASSDIALPSYNKLWRSFNANK